MFVSLLICSIVKDYLSSQTPGTRGPLKCASSLSEVATSPARIHHRKQNDFVRDREEAG